MIFNKGLKIHNGEYEAETLEQLEEIVGNTLEQIDIGKDFLSRTQKAQYLR
jgi:hypothetical protein